MTVTRLEKIGAKLRGWQIDGAAVTVAPDTVRLAGEQVPKQFAGSFVHRDGRSVRVVCRVADGDVTAEYELKGFSDRQLEQLGLPMMRDVLAVYATTFWDTFDRRNAMATELHNRRRRWKITDELIAQVADAYADDGIDAVKRMLGVEERQAWRYVQRAIDAGLVESKRAQS